MPDSYICSGATMRCSMGTSQAKLTVLPNRTVYLTGQPMANISDHQSFVNLGAFGRCRSLGFPATASATAAAHGKLTPMPCVHNTPVPWMGGKNDYIVKGYPALLKSSTCQCMWGGTISITDDGQHGEGTQWVVKKSKQQFTKRQQSADQKNRSNFFSDGTLASSKQDDLDSTKKALGTFLKNNSQWFKNGGFKSFVEETNPNNNGSTDAKGTILLKTEIMNNCFSAFKKIQSGQSIESDEAKSLSTLWHEITHNMHDNNKDYIEEENLKTKQKSKKRFPLSDTDRKYMEIANEFVSRKTLPEFYKSIVKDGDRTYKKVYEPFMSNRDNTGYNNWVRKYDAAIEKYKLNEKVVLNTVKKGLLESDYHKQKTNLINGLMEGGKYYDEKTHKEYNRITQEQAAIIVKQLLDV